MNDMMGPFRQTKGGSSRQNALLDRYSGLSEVGPLPSKADEASCVETQLRELQTLTGKKFKDLRSDNGRESMGTLEQWFARNGSQHQRSTPYMP